jgi:trimeric autotransporter adhesin
MKIKLNVITILLVISAASGRLSTALAQGTAFTYQGRLNSSGSPANGNYDLTFTLFNTNISGVAVAGPITNSTVAVSNGLFTTTIDFGAAAFSVIGSNWLEIAVRTNGHGSFTTLAPRQQLTPAPYAISAENLASVVQHNTIAPDNFNTVGGGFNNFCLGGAATVAGGGDNYSTADFSTVSGGYFDSAGGIYATVGGGYQDIANGPFSTVGGGSYNIAFASGTDATISGGDHNTNSANYSTIGGGQGNYTSGEGYSTICGGALNVASGFAATVAGGELNVASGDWSFAAGNQAQALHTGSFVWNGDSHGVHASTAVDQFSVYASGGGVLNSSAGIQLASDVQIGTSPSDYHHLELGGGTSLGYLYGSAPALNDGVHLGYNWYADSAGTGHVFNPSYGTSLITAAYGEIILQVGPVNTAPSSVRVDVTTAGVSVYGTFNNNSDRNAKQDIAPVSPAEILDKVLQLPVSEWSYKVDAGTRHIGPMAQDFSSTFSIGTDDKHIAPIDEGGVAFAAIQGLNQKLEAEAKIKDAEIAGLNESLAELNQRVATPAAKK